MACKILDYFQFEEIFIKYLSYVSCEITRHFKFSYAMDNLKYSFSW